MRNVKQKWRKILGLMVMACLFTLSPMVSQRVRAEGETVGQHVHTMVHHVYQESGEDTNGNIEYWECSECKKKFLEESGKTEVIDVLLPMKKCFIFENGVMTLRGKLDYGKIYDYPSKSEVVKIIASEGTILPSECYALFANFTNCKSIDLSKADSSYVTGMEYMFNNCTSLESLDVSGFDTSNVTSMQGVFVDCSSLTSLNLSAFDTANVTTMLDMFYNCSGLESLDVSKFNTSKVTIMMNMFSNCGSLTTLDLSSFNTRNVENKDYMFGNCNALNELVLGKDFLTIGTDCFLSNGDRGWACGSAEGKRISGDGSEAVISNSEKNTYYKRKNQVTFAKGVLTLKGYFEADEVRNFETKEDVKKIVALEGTVLPSDCYELFGNFTKCTSIDLAKADSSKVTNMGYMFNECSSLTTLDLSGFDSSNVTNMEAMFSNCSSLTTLNLGGFNTSNATNMNYMFNGCQALNKLVLGKDFRSIGSNCYLYNGDRGWACGSEYTERISGSDMYAVISNSEKNTYYKRKNPVTFAKGVLTLKAEFEADDVKGFAPKEDVKKIVALEGTVLPSDCYGLFRKFTNCTTIDLSKADSSNVTNMEAMFSNCSSLTTLDLSGLDTTNVTKMDYMFCDCSNLTKLDVSKFNTSNVISMEAMLDNCSSLKNLNVNGFNTSNVTNMKNMFNGCNSLTTLDLSSFNTTGVTNIQGMFFNCEALNELVLGKDFQIIESECYLSNGDRGWACGAEDTERISGSDTYAVISNSGNYTYYKRKNPVTFAKGVLTLKSDFEADDVKYFEPKEDVKKIVALEGTILPSDCYGLFSDFIKCTTIDLSKADSSKVTNMGYMFGECSSLTTLDLSGFDTTNVTKMHFMFCDCSNLKTLDISGFNTSNVTSLENMFDSCSSLTTLDLSSFNTAGVTNIQGMFFNCEALNELVLGKDFQIIESECYLSNGDRGWACGSEDAERISGSDTYAVISNSRKNTYYKRKNPVTFAKGVLTLKAYFEVDDVKDFDHKEDVKKIVALEGTILPSDCYGLFSDFTKCTTIDLSKADSSKVTNMGYMFCECSSLTTLDLSGFDTTNVTKMHYMFCDCSNLTTLDISGFNTPNVTNLENMFNGCNSLTTLDLSSFNTAGVTNIQGMFYDCDALNKLVLGKDFRSIGSNCYLYNGDRGWARGSEDAERISGSDTYAVISNSGKNTYYKITKEIHTHGGKNATYHAAVKATCTEAGNSAYCECNCGKYFSDKACTKEIKKNSWVIEATGHKYGTPTYTWSSDNKSVTATKVCKNDKSHKVTEKVSTTYKVVKAATESATGTGRYTATFTKEGFTTQTKDVTLEKLAHKHDGKNVTYHAAVKATCTKAGNSAYYECKCGKFFSDKACTKEINKNSWVIKAKGHNYGTPTYTWSSDNKSVTATKVCKNDASHKVSEKVVTTYEVIKEATKDATGTGRYTATFTKEGFKTQTKDVEIPKLSEKDPEKDPEKDSVTKVFSDVKEGEWFVGAVQFAYDNGIMNGTSKTTFAPNMTLNRAQFVTVLYNFEKRPTTKFDPKKFTDVRESDYFAFPVMWASENNITSGIAAKLFGPNVNIYREQMAVMLYKFAQYKKYKINTKSGVLDSFYDKNQVSSWATEALNWAVSNGIINGKGKYKNTNLGILDPKGTATRAECAQVIKNFVEKIK